MARRALRILALLAALSCAYVAFQVGLTLRTLDLVERERDTWQRPGQILRQLNVGPGATVVDFGSGSGYFALKIAREVAPDGRVLAVDLRRESLAFLWMRAMLRRMWNVRVIHGDVDDPKLPPGAVDAVLIVNTFHELEAPHVILTRLRAALRSDDRLVVVDRAPRHGVERDVHEIDAEVAERLIVAEGFVPVSRDVRFIDRPEDDDVWWMIVFRRR